MKCPTLIAAIARDLEEGHAAILQIVSTNEALLDRRLAEIPASEWADLSIDITPREYVLDYLSHSFPTQLFELYTDDEGNLLSRPAYDADGNPVISREAVERRDRMIEHLASLPPVQGALDQILHRFGTDLVAEVTGRSRRIVKRDDRLCVESRPASANFAETAAFMDDDKRILVFSDAGGTGRSYHADLGCQEPAPAHPLPAGAGLARRCRDPGPRPLEPHQPEAAAGVPAGRDRRQGREALPVDDRAPPRHLGRDHPRPAPDRRAGPVPRRRQSRKPLRQSRAAAVLPAALCRENRGLLARRFSERDRSRSCRPGRFAQGRAAANYAIPEPHSGAQDRDAEPALRRLRAIARCAHRSRSCRRHLRHRRRDADRRELPASPNAVRCTPTPRRAPKPAAIACCARTATARCLLAEALALAGQLAAVC